MLVKLGPLVMLVRFHIQIMSVQLILELLIELLLGMRLVQLV